MKINYNGAVIEVDLKQYSDEKILKQRNTAIELQERLAEFLGLSPDEMKQDMSRRNPDDRMPDWNDLAEQIAEMERELEERGYYENPDTNEYLLNPDYDPDNYWHLGES